VKSSPLRTWLRRLFKRDTSSANEWGHKWAVRERDEWGLGLDCVRCGKHFHDEEFLTSDGPPICTS
jgi:hypothetical protein